MTRHTALALALSLALLLGSLGPPRPLAPVPGAAAAAESAYTIVDLGPLDGPSSWVRAVNEAGQVVGYKADHNGFQRAFLWQSGQALDLGTLGGEQSGAFGINDDGQVVGWAHTPQGQIHAFLWQNGQMTDLGTFGGGGSEAVGINNAGQVVGKFVNAQGQDRPFLWQGGQMTDLGTPDDGNSHGVGINNAGQVVGGFAPRMSAGDTGVFIWQNGQRTVLAHLDVDMPASFATGISDSGQVVGYSYIPVGVGHDAFMQVHATLWQDGQVTDLDGRDDRASLAYAINATGQIVGLSLAGGVQDVVLWEHGQMVVLQSLLPPDSGWTLDLATDISNGGIIVGTGTLNGEVRAFAMFPTGGPGVSCGDPQVPAPPRGGQARQFGALTVRADSFGGSGANWTASGTVWLGSYTVVEGATLAVAGGVLTGSGRVSLVTAGGPERVTPLLADSFAIGTDGILTPRAAGGHTLRLPQLGGFCVQNGRYDLSLDLARGVLSGSANLQLRVPQQPLVAKPFSFTLTTSGHLSGLLLEPATFDLGLLDLTVATATLGGDGIATRDARLLADLRLGGASAQLPDQAFLLTAADGLATTLPIILPPLRFGATGDFGLEEVRATLTFDGGSYRFVGAGTLLLPGVVSRDSCKIGATLELVSAPPPLREASFSVSGGCVKIPIGITGAFITGFSGKTSASETDLALDFTMDVIYGAEVPVLGQLISGTLGAHWDTTWRVGLTGTAKVFRWDVGNASLTLSPNDGLRGTLTLRMVPVIEGTGTIHAWEDGGSYHLTGHADTTVAIRAGGLIRACETIGVELCLLVPPADMVGPSENADFGEFRTATASSLHGLKGYLNLFGYQPAFFVDGEGVIDFDLGGLVGYQLVDQPASASLRAFAALDTVATLRVDAAAALIVGLAYDSGSPTLTLTDPQGRTIDAATVASDVSVSATMGQLLYTVANPAPGTWTVRVGNHAGDERTVLRAFGATVAPQITQAPVATPTADGYTVTVAGTAGPAATFSLFYDDDNAGHDGRAIARGLPLSQAMVAWDTRAVPTGSYYLYALLDDPTAAPVFAYGANPVTVSDGAAPGAPNGVGATLAGAAATVSWTPPADVDLAGFRLYYSEPNGGTTFVTAIPDPRATGYSQPGLALDGTWTLAVSAYDINGHEGPRSAAVTLPVVAYIPVPAPVRATPAGGPVAGGTTVTITGLGFEPGAGVTFGDLPATDVRVVDARTIVAVAPAHAPGPVVIAVTGQSGSTGLLAGGYRYDAPVDPPPTPSPSATPSPPPGPMPSPSPSPSAEPVTPPGPAPSFADVPADYWARDPILRFAARGITTGCGDDAQGQRLYCPERGVTRAEMAVFLTRALGQATQAPPATPTFADVPADHWAYGPIEAFVALGITTGCGTDDQGRRVFCPDRGVTRAEMAVFLDRARGQAELAPGTPTFADVPPSYWAYGWIERFFTLGVTTGCGTDEQGRKVYCPDRGVTRAEMAVFIIRAYPE